MPLSCGGPSPTNQQTRRGRPCLCPYALVVSATEFSECPCFCEMALPAPERRRRLFCNNDIPFYHVGRPADVPTPYGRSSDGPHHRAPLSQLQPTVLTDWMMVSRLVYEVLHCTVLAQPCHPASVCFCLLSLYPTQSHLSLTGLAPPLLSAAVAPDWSSGAPLTQHASGRASLSLFSPHATCDNLGNTCPML